MEPFFFFTEKQRLLNECDQHDNDYSIDADWEVRGQYRQCQKDPHRLGAQ